MSSLHSIISEPLHLYLQHLIMQPSYPDHCYRHENQKLQARYFLLPIRSNGAATPTHLHYFQYLISSPIQPYLTPFHTLCFLHQLVCDTAAESPDILSNKRTIFSKYLLSSFLIFSLFYTIVSFDILCYDIKKQKAS